MYAVVEIAGSQFEVEPGDIIEVPRLNAEPEQKVEFKKILLAGSDGKTSIGDPYVNGTVEAEVLEHFKGSKVLVFKKKRRKGYRKLNGHRQWFTLIGLTKFEIDGFDIEEVEIALEEEYEEEVLGETEEIEEQEISDEAAGEDYEESEEDYEEDTEDDDEAAEDTEGDDEAAEDTEDDDEAAEDTEGDDEAAEEDEADEDEEPGEDVDSEEDEGSDEDLEDTSEENEEDDTDKEKK